MYSGWKVLLSSFGLLKLFLCHLQPLRVSLLYETAPEHVTDQPAFLNAALLGRTDLPPLNLLYNIKRIEKASGRDPQGPRWGPRSLDLDIIFYGADTTDHESLSIPHPRWQERGFVKAPIADLLQPEDVKRGFIHEAQGPGSVVGPLKRAVQLWEAEGGEQQVGWGVGRVPRGHGPAMFVEGKRERGREGE
jgi:2-amino-4-hydroxy-6-hydroxymethyldihydropteridine diphosphokinase/dihydropteroate synthase